MFFDRVRSLLRPFLPARSCSSRALVSAGSVLSPDDTARFLAGMTVMNPAAAALSATPAFREHTALMERDYGIIQTSRLVPMRSWSLSELAEISAATHTLFYVFGGPDVTTALELFPKTTTYVLIGLEPVGEPPHLSALDAERLAVYLADVRNSLRDFFSVSYFKTIEMNTDLRVGKANGIIPLLLAMLARAGSTVHRLTPVEFSPRGTLLPLATFPLNRSPKNPHGVRIDASLRDQPRTIYYFAHDLRDDTFTPDSGGYLYYTGLGFQTSFLKAASYLMHFREFGNARNLVLSHSRYLLQDDTGIPYRYLKGAWNSKLYGQLLKPVESFNDVLGAVVQPQLEACYARTNEVSPMPFHMGYHWMKQQDAWMRWEKIERNERPGTPATR